ncbi:LysR family transcriptional regulator [Paenibacillus planticolens]|uniref:LysR family transcriptional regulator n=1 Tax=Paenibacillus planticolens TaxID=2654976 RepID=A0ABX1ZNR5_9BACL|nr:LysR family transcriptional regulator [Paenibacillus planticolens]NOV00409.1 LysR family transcriptional regulator [Paenibacillus planticolens]
MDIRQLQYLLEIAKHMNFTKAAEALHVTQPTLSKMVKNIEEELGATLFDRSGKYVQLTDSGQAAVQQIGVIMQAVQDLHLVLDDVANLKKGTITIGLPPVVGSVFFARVIAKFQTLHPGIHFRIVEEGAKHVESLVHNRKLDLGVVVGPVDTSAFETLPFMYQKLALIIHREHPLAKQSSVSLLQLRSEPFILFPSGYAVRNHVMHACRTVGFEPSVVYESSQWDLLAEMVASKAGISIVPETICSKITSPEVLTLPLIEPSIPWDLVIIWPKDHYVSYAMREFISFSLGLSDNEP